MQICAMAGFAWKLVSIWPIMAQHSWLYNYTIKPLSIQSYQRSMSFQSINQSISLCDRWHKVAWSVSLLWHRWQSVACQIPPAGSEITEITDSTEFLGRSRGMPANFLISNSRSENDTLLKSIFASFFVYFSKKPWLRYIIVVKYS